MAQNHKVGHQGISDIRNHWMEQRNNAASVIFDTNRHTCIYCGNKMQHKLFQVNIAQTNNVVL